MSELTPITRVESYLDAIVNNGIPPTEDITRIETFLQAIYDNQVCALTPITRIEMFLGKISGQNIVLPEPITRIELYLAAIAGEDVELPENPITRLEMYLAEWADSGDWTTISGAIVEFITQRAHKLKSCVVSLSPKQDLSHGDPSPTNICPISGWTGCEAFVRGHNMWDEEWETGGINYTDGTNTPYTTRVRSKNYIPVKPETSYRFNFQPNVYGLVIVYFNEQKEYISGSWIGNAGNPFTTPANAYYIKFCTGDAYGGTYKNDISINYPSTDTEYHAYNGNSYSVTFGETVYGATPDLVSGEMPVTMVEVDLGSLTWTKTGSGSQIFFYTALPNGSKVDTSLCVCSMYKTAMTALEFQDNDKICRQYGSEYWNFSRIGIKDSAYNDSTATEFKAAMSGVQLVYTLDTPTETTITPTPITALKGYNAVWSDGGDIEVTVHGTPVELSTQQALNMLLGGAYHNNQTADDVSDEEALDIILGGDNK